MRSKKYLLILTTIFLMAFTPQQKDDLIGKWERNSYRMDGKVVPFTHKDIVILNRDGSYKQECKEPDAVTPADCDSGKWRLDRRKVLHFDRDKKYGAALRPIDIEIHKVTIDSLVLKGKEGKKDILVYYLRK